MTQQEAYKILGITEEEIEAAGAVPEGTEAAGASTETSQSFDNAFQNFNRQAVERLIKKKYRQRILSAHPDVQPEEETEHSAQQLNYAYAYLKKNGWYDGHVSKKSYQVKSRASKTQVWDAPVNLRAWREREIYSYAEDSEGEKIGYFKIAAGKYRFNVATSKIAFEGFRLIYTEAGEEKDEKGVLLKGLDENSELSLEQFDSKQHFTQPPAHYTEASLVKTLEELGIGRPSTYAPTITTIINRRYVAKENKNLYMTELGEVVNNMMKEAFPSIVDVNFTATMEALLDRVGDGSVPWKTVVENFWPDLYEAVTEAEKNLEEVKVEDEVTDVICENCGRNMVVKYGPHGKFLACPGFPDCKNTKPYLEKIGVPCPKCGKEVILRKTKKGRKYYGCENNPECDFMSWQKPSAKKCPQCGGYMLEKGNKLVCADEQCGYVEAREKKDED